MTVIDVRTPNEFMLGNVQGSINIPLSILPEKLDKIKLLPKPIRLCCASGIRSAQAAAFLKSHNVECENVGSWLDVELI